MTENIILLIISVSSWWIITFLELFEKHLTDPEGSGGVSILPEVIIMPIITFGVGFAINYFFTNMGSWIIGVLLGCYIVWGIINMLVTRKEKT